MAVVFERTQWRPVAIGHVSLVPVTLGYGTGQLGDDELEISHAGARGGGEPPISTHPKETVNG
jgi:hypothetical protein